MKVIGVLVDDVIAGKYIHICFVSIKMEIKKTVI